MVSKKSQFIDNIQEIVLIEEPDSTIKYANSAFCDFYGKSINEVVGKKLLDFIIPEDRPGCNMEFVVSPEHPEYRVEGRTVKANGQVAWIQYLGKGIFDAKGKLVEFQEVGMDISKWKEKIESNVKKLEMKSNQISSIALTDSKYLKVSAEAKRMGNIAIYSFDDIVTRNAKMLTLIEQAKVVARGNSAIMIEGESGTGKELLAQAIHNASKRANGAFVAINCGSISPGLLQSELFGYVQGAFTGAAEEGRQGKFEMAHMGTIFLDEIGEMSLEQQVVLLRVLETKTVTRIGSNKSIPVDVRIICASNMDLYKAMCEKKFRSDLYFRLNVINLYIPPLRERKDDIYLLMKHIMKSFQGETNSIINISDEQLRILYRYSWPGNVRELRNIIERILYVPNYDLNQLLLNEQSFYESNNNIKGQNYKKAIGTDDAEMERSILESKLEECNGNITLVAKKLGVSRKTIYKKMEKYNICNKR